MDQRASRFRILLITVPACLCLATLRSNTFGVLSVFDRHEFDLSCSPCDDFYRFVNGGWIRQTPIPDDSPRWGRYEVASAKHDETLKRLVETVSHAGSRRRFQQQLGDFYSSCMDTATVEAAGLAPIREPLNRIDHIKTVNDLADALAALHRVGSGVPFQVTVESDERNRRQNIAVITQGALGLPTARHYLDGSDDARGLREQYVKHIIRVFALSGLSDEESATEGSRVLRVESVLASGIRAPTNLLHPEANYNKMTGEGLDALAPHFPWQRYWRSLGAPFMRELVVRQPEFLSRFDDALVKIPPLEWRGYLRWHIIRQWSSALPSAYVNASFEFYGRRLMGTKSLGPRWKRCMASVKRHLAPELGRLYVEEEFLATARADASKLIHQLVTTLRTTLGTLTWMTPQTRLAALEKLDSMSIKVGRPERWLERNNMVVGRDRFIDNIVEVTKFETGRRLDAIGREVDTAEWNEQPYVINAFYRPEANEIVIPAAIFQPPFYDGSSRDAVNFGAVGSVIAHELTHAFDDIGRRYDANGRLRDWWTAEDEAAFASRVACVEDQLESFTSVGGQHINGKLVVGEGLADLGGVTLAYRSWKTSMPNAPDDDEFTADQMFFIGWARLFGGSLTLSYERILLSVSIHPLPHIRPLAPLQNMEEFAKAFNCKTHERMFRARSERCSMW